MAAVQGIVHTYSGEVAVESQLHKGSVVRISISLQQSTKIQEIDNQLQIPNEILRGSGTILVVDDEDIVLSVIISMLESLDFEVITIMDGEEGITKFETHVDRNFFAVILDRTMPKMDGKEVLQVIQKRSKPIPAIVCSGYSNSSFSQSFHEDEYANSIAKPFKLNVLNEHLSRFIN